MEKPVLLSTAYLPPIQYFTKFLLGVPIWMELHENYIKQTFRNRCTIMGANGLLNLSIPVKRGSFHKVVLGELEVDYDTRWQQDHWNSIESAYRSAPFFEYYSHEFKPFFDVKEKRLFRLNQIITEKCLELLDVDNKAAYTQQFIPADDPDFHDYRVLIQPKSKLQDPLFAPSIYYQVFADRFGFVPNLSIVDLIFHLGPDARAYLEDCIPRNNG